MADLKEDGYMEDEYGNELGWCNSCGEEAPRDQECCEDGEVMPFDDDFGNRPTDKEPE